MNNDAPIRRFPHRITGWVPPVDRIAEALLEDPAVLHLSDRTLSYDIRARFNVDRHIAHAAIETARRQNAAGIATNAIAFDSAGLCDQWQGTAS